jgi:hypothetical protein
MVVTDTLARVAMDAAASGGLTRRTKRCSVRRNGVVLAPRPWRYLREVSSRITGARKAAPREEHL